MNMEPDPYAPPRVDPLPAAAALPLDSGSLWRVVDGHMQFRDGAVLPGIGPDGSPNVDSASQFPLVLETKALPALVRGVGLLLLGVACLAGMFPFRGARIGLLLALLFLGGFLPRWLGAKVQIQLFRSKSKEQAAVYRVLLAALALGVLQFSARSLWPGIHPEEFWACMGMAFGVYQLFLLVMGKAPHAREVEDGWFEWKGLKQEAIPYLEEIQRRNPPVGPT